MIQKNFGLAIKKLREETGLSQEKFALSIGMDRTYYASVEAGKRNISLQNIYKIAEGFNISVSALFVVVEKMDTEELEKRWSTLEKITKTDWSND